MNQKRKVLKSIVTASIFLFAIIFANNIKASDDFEVVDSSATSTTIRIYSTGGDGFITTQPYPASWSSQHSDIIGRGVIQNEIVAFVGAYNFQNGYLAIERGFVSFDTSVIPVGAIVQEASVEFNLNFFKTEFPDSHSYIALVEGSQDSGLEIINSDVDNIGNTLVSDKYIPKDGDLDTYVKFKLYGNSLELIKKDGFSKFAIREGHDFENNTETVENYAGSVWKRNSVIFSPHTAEQSKRPYIEITYTTEPEPELIHPVVLVHGLMGSIEKDGVRMIDPIFHIYDNLITAMTYSGYELDQDLFIFNYDWREDNVVTAGVLRQKILEIKNETGFDQVDIVAHSMGGLVARAYIDGDDYADDVDQLIMLGSPQQGAPSAYLAWGGAYFYGGFSQIKKFKFLTETIANGYSSLVDYIREGVPSTGQLLPTYDYLYEQDAGIWTAKEYNDAYPRNTFLENLNDEASITALGEKVEVTAFVSEKGDLGDESTLNGLRIVSDPNTADDKWEYGFPIGLGENDSSFVMGDGDGTVPRTSLEFLEIGETGYAIDMDHHAIITKSQQEIIKRLRGEEVTEYYEGLIGAVDRLLFIRAYSPIDFLVIDPNGNKVGKVFASSTEENSILGAFYSGFNSDAEFVTIPNPAEGEYRILVQSVGSGRYGIGVNVLDSEQYEEDNIFWDDIAEGEYAEFTFNYSAGAACPEIVQVIAEVELTGFDKLIQDTEDLYASGDIKRKYLKKVLIGKFQHLKIFQEKHSSLDSDSNRRQQAKKIFYERVIKIGLSWSKKILNYNLRKERITPKAHATLTTEINKMLENY